MTLFSRTSRFGQNLSPYENGYAHGPAVETAGGLLGSRVNPTLPDHKTSRIN
jgi:hypothetical protein